MQAADCARIQFDSKFDSDFARSSTIYWPLICRAKIYTLGRLPTITIVIVVVVVERDLHSLKPLRSLA